jgi:ABC-2 type transport system permease protein
MKDAHFPPARIYRFAHHAGLVARKTLLELLREPQLLIMMLALPLFFMVISAVGYGTSPKLATYTVLVQLNDPRGQALLDVSAAQRYPDGRPIFRLQPAGDLAQAEQDLLPGRAALLWTLQPGPQGEIVAIMRGDATSLPFIRASTELSRVISPHIDQISYAGVKPRPVAADEVPLFARSQQSEFDNYAVGMMVFAILMLIPQTAMLLARELRTGTLRRLQLTRLSAWELVAGVTLSQLAVAVVEVLVMFFSALAFGFHAQGSLGLAVAICLLLSFAAIGPGLIVVGFSRNDSDALNIGSTFTMLQVFLSGAFFAMPPFTLFTLQGQAVDALDFLPANHAMLALTRVLVDGAGVAQVAARLAALTVLSLLFFWIGVVVFQRRHYRAA